jgi:hypothetical protein
MAGSPPAGRAQGHAAARGHRERLVRRVQRKAVAAVAEHVLTLGPALRPRLDLQRHFFDALLRQAARAQVRQVLRQVDPRAVAVAGRVDDLQLGHQLSTCSPAAWLK